MVPQLCKTCLAIPSEFWSQQFDDQGFPRGVRAELQSFRSMQAAAARGYDNTGNVRLVALDVEDIKHGDLQPEYTALSHYWGPPERHPIKTTTKNLDEMMTRILINKLPNTFRDAVDTTRELGKRFLWIDSLCIIQDDEDDWAKESALMASVYGQSYCTLAALSSQNATEGCRLVPHIRTAICRSTEIDTQDEYHNSYRIRFFEREPRDWHKEYGDNPYTHSEFGTPETPLRSRAWTLQERELSVRKIHFSKDQLLWECCELKASAQLPWHHKTTEDDLETFPVRNALTENTVPGGPVAMRDRWYQLMEDYSTRSLTNKLDTLPALSGLAQQYQDIDILLECGATICLQRFVGGANTMMHLGLCRISLPLGHGHR
ncbi:MAG: hypothetical protein Q9213_001261 [Squamulea squamosa]